ncbi:MAG: NifB/NifX family molybdenum-iron cluster-binding protein [Spirochaetota bacterium]
MKVLVPVTDDSGRESQVGDGLHDDGFICYDSADDSYTYASREKISDGYGNLLSFLEHNAIDRIITVQIGTLALQALQLRGIAVFHTEKQSVTDAVSGLMGGALDLVTQNRSVRSPCSSDCSACTSSCS